MACFMLNFEHDAILTSHSMQTLRAILALLMIFGGALQTTHATAIQSLEAISAAIRDTLTPQLAADHAAYQLTIEALDPRLRLPACQQALEVFQQSGNLHAGRVTTGVRCSDPVWLIYVPVTVQFSQSVVVLTQPVQRGDFLTAQHVTLQTRDVARLPKAYLTDVAQAVGKQTQRALAAGSVLNRHDLSEPLLVKRGQQVMIEAASPAFSIRMNGQALADGALGQRIRVKNTSSGRIIEARVVQANVVQVDF